MQRKISYFTAYNDIIGKAIKYAKVVVYNKPTIVHSLKFRMNIIYNVPAVDVDNPSAYLQPIGHPDYNSNRAFNIYRKKTGFLFPKSIKHARKMAHLSLAETSAVLGISQEALSGIENEKHNSLQTENQDTILRFLFHKKCLAKLIEARLPLIKIKHYKHVDINHLKHVIERLIA